MKSKYKKHSILIPVLSLIIMSISCGKDVAGPLSGAVDENVNPVNPLTEPVSVIPEVPPVTEEPITVKLIAEKKYKPTQREDGIHNPEVGILVRVPEYVDVTSGNAGNYKLSIYFDKIKCIYIGGATISRPLKKGDNIEEINLGKKYHFDKCVDKKKNEVALNPLEFASVVNVLKLRVENGDSTQTTVVEHEFEVAQD